MLPARTNGARPIVPNPSCEHRWLARWRLARIVALLVLYLPLHGLWRLARRPSPWPRSFLRAAGRAAGVDTVIAGVPVGGNVLIVANHLSWLDILILAGATGARFVAKAEVTGWPLLGFLAAQNRTIYVARDRPGEVRTQSDTLRSALAEGRPVALFAEGGTGDGRTLRPFHAALFSALFPATGSVAVQPVAIDYGIDRETIAWRDTGVAEEAIRNMAMAGRRRVTLRFLAPIEPVTFADRKAIARETRARIAAALDMPC